MKLRGTEWILIKDRMPRERSKVLVLTMQRPFRELNLICLDVQDWLNHQKGKE